jgi:hypothetical protein
MHELKRSNPESMIPGPLCSVAFSNIFGGRAGMEQFGAGVRPLLNLG